MKEPLVSVIVPTYNSSQFLDSCLQSIQDQTYRNIELLVIDNNSTDNTKQIAKKYTDKVFNKGPERSAQRNYGVSKCYGKYALIIDSDMILSNQVIGSCVEKVLSNPSVKAIVIPEESFGEGFWAQCKKLERSFYIGVEWMEAARFFDKETYLRVGGYDELLISGEDWDLSQRVEAVGSKGRIKEFIYHNEGHPSLAGIVKKKIYYATKFLAYQHKSKDTAQTQLQTNIFQRYKLYFSDPAKLLQNPLLGAGMLFMKTCEFGAGGVALIRSHLIPAVENTHPVLNYKSQNSINEYNYYLFRNCFTGATAGGDVHSSGIYDWINTHKKGADVYIVHPENDNQEKFYPEVANLQSIKYPSINIRASYAITFIIRAIMATLFVKLPTTQSKNFLVASSHFLPDVLPVAFKLIGHPNTTRVVYIHHIIQDMNRPKSLNTILANLQERICFYLIKKRFDKIVVINQGVATDLRERGFTKQTILLSGCFVNQGAEILSYHQKKHTIVFCGRLVKQKGVYDFLTVCKILQNKLPNFSAVMIGAGPEEEKLISIIRKEKLNIQMAGFIDNKKKFQYVSESILFVFPSKEEGWGIAIAEALAVGTPVVAYELEVYKEIFGSALHLSPINQPDLLAKITLDLLQSYDKTFEKYHEEQITIKSLADSFSINTIADKEYAYFLET